MYVAVCSEYFTFTCVGGCSCLCIVYSPQVDVTNLIQVMRDMGI